MSKSLTKRYTKKNSTYLPGLHLFVSASFLDRRRQTEFTTNILAKIRPILNFCKESKLQRLHDNLYS